MTPPHTPSPCATLRLLSLILLKRAGESGTGGCCCAFAFFAQSTVGTWSPCFPGLVLLGSVASLQIGTEGPFWRVGFSWPPAAAFSLESSLRLIEDTVDPNPLCLSAPYMVTRRSLSLLVLIWSYPGCLLSWGTRNFNFKTIGKLVFATKIPYLGSCMCMLLSHTCLTADQAASLTMKLPYKTSPAVRVLSIPIFLPSGRGFKVHVVIRAE